MRLDDLKLYMLIKKQEKTQGQLAEAVGISRNTMNGIFKGRSCREETAERIAAALGVDLAEITEKRK